MTNKVTMKVNFSKIYQNAIKNMNDKIFKNKIKIR